MRRQESERAPIEFGDELVIVRSRHRSESDICFRRAACSQYMFSLTTAAKACLYRGCLFAAPPCAGSGCARGLRFGKILANGVSIYVCSHTTRGAAIATTIHTSLNCRPLHTMTSLSPQQRSKSEYLEFIAFSMLRRCFSPRRKISLNFAVLSSRDAHGTDTATRESLLQILVDLSCETAFTLKVWHLNITRSYATQELQEGTPSERRHPTLVLHSQRVHHATPDKLEAVPDKRRERLPQATWYYDIHRGVHERPSRNLIPISDVCLESSCPMTARSLLNL